MMEQSIITKLRNRARDTILFVPPYRQAISYVEQSRQDYNLMLDEIERLQEVVDKAVNIEDELRAELAQYRWIPITEELPQSSGCYHVCYRKGTTWDFNRVRLAYFDTRFHNDVTHWAPLPLPPE